MRWRWAWLIALGLACLLLLWVGDHTSRGGSRSPPPVPTTIETNHESSPEKTGSSRTPGEERPPDAIRSGAVSGVILVDGTNNPPQGPVLVVLRSRAIEHRTTSDARGRFRLSDVRYPAAYQLRCTAEELGIRHEEIVRVGEDREEIEVLVEPKTLVTGFVLDTTGAPVAGAGVHVQAIRGVVVSRSGRESPVGPIESTKSDVLGAFRLEILRLDSTEQRVRVAAGVAAGHFPGEGEFRVVTLVRCEAVVRLRRAPTVSGRVVDERGKPLQAAGVKLAVFRHSPHREGDEDSWRWGPSGINHSRSANGEETAYREVRTKSDGLFRVSPVFDGHPTHLIIGRADRPHRIMMLKRLRSDLEMGDIALPRPAHPVHVRFRYKDGDPKEGVGVTFQSMALPQWALLNSARRMSDAQGALRSTFLVDGGTYNLFLGTRKGLRYLERVVITDGMTITIPD